MDCLICHEKISMMFCTLTMSESLVFNKLILYEFWLLFLKNCQSVTSTGNNTACSKLYRFHFQTDRLSDRHSDKFQDRFSDRSSRINGTIESHFKSTRTSSRNNPSRGDYTFSNYFWQKVTFSKSLKFSKIQQRITKVKIIDQINFCSRVIWLTSTVNLQPRQNLIPRLV